MENKVKPSSATRPDLDWSQVRETVLMLNVAVTQIERAMKEGDDSVTMLAKSFTGLLGHMQAIAKAAENLPGDEEKDTITTNSKAVSEKINAVIVAFQFYDRLAQRLSHVGYSLTSMTDLISDPHRLYNPYEWAGLQEVIKSRYTIRSDRAMFEAILDGATVDEALDASAKLKEEEAAVPDDNVELF